MRKLCLALLIASLGHLTVAAGEAEPFLGRWNVEILDATDGFSTAWLEVAQTDGDLSGRILWKWGSVGPVQDISVEDGELSFRRGGQTFTARVVDGKLRGLSNGESPFVGAPASEMCDVGGTWKVVQEERPEAGPITLVLEAHDGAITGKAYDSRDEPYSVEDAKLDGYVLRFVAEPEETDGPTAEVRCEIRGDRLAGEVRVTPEGKREEETVPIRGQREREWGEPVRLLADSGLEGWKAARPGRELGWTVQDGVLENDPPDVDIQSAKEFGDHRLHLEYKVDRNANSGVYLRGRYELQILGDERVRDHGNMAVYSRLSPEKNPIELGEWNELDVTLIGRWLTVVLNGVTVHDNRYLEGPTGGALDGNEDEPGPLILQGDHGKVRFRNITVTPAK